MKLLVDQSDLVTVTVYCWEQDGEVEASHLKSDVPKSGIDLVEQVDFTFKKPSYAESNTIIRNSNIRMEGAETSLDASAFQDQVLRSLLQSWTLKNEGGEKVPLNSGTVGNLIPSVARAAIAGVLELVRI